MFWGLDREERFGVGEHIGRQPELLIHGETGAEERRRDRALLEQRAEHEVLVHDELDGREVLLLLAEFGELGDRVELHVRDRYGGVVAIGQGAEAMDYTILAQKDDIKPIEVEISKLNNIVSNIEVGWGYASW